MIISRKVLFQTRILDSTWKLLVDSVVGTRRYRFRSSSYPLAADEKRCDCGDPERNHKMVPHLVSSLFDGLQITDYLKAFDLFSSLSSIS